MGNNILKSSIKAYCRELLETSTLGCEGGYLTKKAYRKTTPKDNNSPTGFESSPKPNMYTKTMKFKIVDPKDRINSKDLWKGEHLGEIKVNKPIYDISSLENLYSSIPDNREREEVEDKYFGKYPGTTYLDELFPKLTKKDINQFYNELLGIKNIKEIKINNPNLVKLVPGKYYDFLRFVGNQAVKEFAKHPRFHSLEEINGKKILWELGYKYKGVETFEDHEYYQFIDPYDEDFIGWGKEHIEDLLKKNLIRIGSKQEGAMNESRYTQFKRKTSQPKSKEILHKAIKEVQMKLDEVNRLIEFTARIKGELQENDQEIEYLKRTKDSLYKIQDKLKEAFQNISKINEIKINKPPRIWDFNKYIPNFTGKDIKVGDNIKIPNQLILNKEAGIEVTIPNIDNKVEEVDTYDVDPNELNYYIPGQGDFSSNFLRDINNKNKTKQYNDSTNTI